MSHYIDILVLGFDLLYFGWLVSPDFSLTRRCWSRKNTG